MERSARHQAVRTTGRPRVALLEARHLNGVARLFRRCFPLEAAHAHGAWNASGGAMTALRLRQRILARPFFDPQGAFVLMDGERVAGFCIAVHDPGRDPAAGGLVALAVDRRFRRRGFGSDLLERAERFLAGRGAQRVHAGFAGHPLSILGGVPLNETAYPFFLNRGYRTGGSPLQVMSQETARYRMGKAIRERIRHLEREGIRIGPYRPAQRAVLERFLRRNFPDWRENVLRGVAQAKSLIVAARGETMLGYAGPYRVMPSGTGTFSSVGVAGSARGLGIGAAVFNQMCDELRKGGARLVSLTTNTDNPAQDIYARAGFRAQFVIDFKMAKAI